MLKIFLLIFALWVVPCFQTHPTNFDISKKNGDGLVANMPHKGQMGAGSRWWLGGWWAGGGRVVDGWWQLEYSSLIYPYGYQ